MKEATKPGIMRCPVCKREYPEEDNYCEYDGSALEQARATSGKHVSLSARSPMTADDVTQKPIV